MARRKVVWILGSGFSKSLGGPLLKDLLTKRRHDLVDVTFTNPALPQERIVAYNIFEGYRETQSRAGYWEHAEEFLDFVDAASDPSSPRYALLNQLLRAKTQAYSVEALREYALLSVASECSTYTAIDNLRGESWEPYLRFKDELVRAPDAVLTFNYDIVLERMNIHGDADTFGIHTVRYPYTKPYVGSGVPIYKLHGSADWVQKGDLRHTFSTIGKLTALVNHPDLKDHRLLLAAPGATKKLMCRGPFEEIWEDAQRELELAEVIVFIGYRFPPSDSHARSSILGAIARNDSPYLRIHTVLGPNLHEPDTVRLINLLHHTLRRSGKAEHGNPRGIVNVQDAHTDPVYDLIPQPLYAEDFLSVADDYELFGPNPELAYRHYGEEDPSNGRRPIR